MQVPASAADAPERGSSWQLVLTSQRSVLQASMCNSTSVAAVKAAAKAVSARVDCSVFPKGRRAQITVSTWGRVRMLLPTAALCHVATPLPL